MTIIDSIREFLSIPVVGLKNEVQPVMGFNYGAKNTKDKIYFIILLCMVDVLYILKISLKYLLFGSLN